MDYQGFKDFLVTFLWRDGDTVLTANLDSLIVMANTELNRLLKVEDRTVTATAPATDTTVTTPEDYREMRSLSLVGVGPMTYLSPLEFSRQDTANVGRQRLPIFTVSNNLILLSGDFSVENPATLSMVYYSNVPDFRATDASWVADNYLDVYAYCALKHAAPFLREDDRLQVWKDAYGAALQSALDENANRKYTGSPQQITYGGGVY